MRLFRPAATILLLSYASIAIADPNPYNQTFSAFESGQVRPLALTPDKKFLLALNTPDAKLEIFRVQSNGLEHRTSVPVGLEPVSVAVRNDEEAWVVNHVSDSVSVIALKDKNSYVKRTIQVLQDLAGQRVELAPCLGQTHLAGAAVHHLHAQNLLQILDDLSIGILF